MSAELVPIDIDPDSELGRALDETSGPLIVLRGNTKFRVTRIEEDDLWANYDPDLVLQRLNELSGKLSDEAAERYLEIVRVGREAGTRPPDRP